jgi:putative ABC transport system substrate-binding protein
VEEILAWKPDAILVKSVKAVAAFKKFAPEKPIVFAWVPDPVGAGIVESLVRPGGNATGVSMPLREFALKRIELLREILPRARRFAVLFDSRSDTGDETLALIDGAALRAGLQAVRVDVGAGGIAEAFARIRRTKCEAVLITGVIEDPRYLDLAVKFQEEAKIPFLDDAAESAEAGMVLGLGEDSLDHFRRAAGVTALLLRGGSPSTTPVDISRRIWLWVNAGAARKLGIALPASILARADRVFQ